VGLVTVQAGGDVGGAKREIVQVLGAAALEMVATAGVADAHG